MKRILPLLFMLLACGGARAQDSAPALQSLLEAGRVDVAIESLEQELGENPFDPIQLNNLAVARTRKGDVYAGLDLLDRAARLSPNQPIIAENRKQLREWLAARIGANAQLLEANARPIPPSLPDPPALWGSASKVQP
ncbi:tetratricopeptide repeat protein [Solimonas sp. SE-A11]|uniref:tetratricopeptide repeat protein n=1 Tax=Solimonas sp. SE-A11 TaxID=3054954 RepID=UPI00259C806F|nr:tetratricopeptide repeat protein [Solimonas sp. SE-A11]MDM4771991.1 hypothetical protein [Solimonas sp. SE-A11]